MDCVTKSHRGHEFNELETILREKRVSLQQELKNLESNVLREWQDLLIEARKVTSDFIGQVDGIEKELEGRAKEFHQRVEEIKENAKQKLQEIKTSNLAILQEQEKKVSDGLEKVKQEAKECEDRLRSSDIESLLEHDGAKGGKKDILPTIFNMTPSVHFPSQIDTKALTEMFGQLIIITKSNQGGEGHSQSQKSSMGTAETQTVSETNQGDEASHGRPSQALTSDTQTCGATASIKPPTQLIPKPSVQSKFRTETEYPSVTCVGSGLAWVQTDTETIQLVDRHGAVKDTIHTDFNFFDMVLSPQGDILLTDRTNYCIKSITGAEKKVKTLFKLQWIPCGLCCLHSGDIAVTFPLEGRVVIYSASGKVIKELDRKLFTRPFSVAQSKVNSDLYISDNCPVSGKVVALDKDYRVRYEYTGQRDGGLFSPRGMCTDNARVLITDYKNHRVHILDRDGVFIQYLLTGEQGLRQPIRIDVDSEGDAWVGDNNGVKVVKYLQ